MNILKSIGAVLAGIIFIGVTHSVMDLILEKAGIFTPPESEIRYYVDGCYRPDLSNYIVYCRRLFDGETCPIQPNASRDRARDYRHGDEYCRSNRVDSFGLGTGVVSDRSCANGAAGGLVGRLACDQKEAVI